MLGAVLQAGIAIAEINDRANRLPATMRLNEFMI